MTPPPRGRPVWRRPTASYGCGRDPGAGPGSCHYWWEGCPKPEKRSCYLAWVKSAPVIAYWAARAPADWSPVPDGFPQGAGATLIREGLIEGREAQGGAPAMWRRKPAREAAA